MNNPPLDALVAAADQLEQYLFESARADDPHRLATELAAFDDGKAARSIVIDVRAGMKRRITLRLFGTVDGKETTLDLHAIVVDKPAAH